MELFATREATSEDISSILDIQSSRLLDNLTQKDILITQDIQKIVQDGFLVHPMDMNYIQDLMRSEDNIVEIVLYQNQIIWYIVLYDLCMQEEERWNRLSLEVRKKIPQWKKIIYWKHVAIKAWFDAMGLGTFLEKKSFEKAKNKWFDYLLMEVAKSVKRDWNEFANQRSMQYHINRWFEKIWEITYGEKESLEIWHVMLKKL